MTQEQIPQAIPPRDPFLLVDEILEQDDAKIVCTKTFSGEEDFFAGHYPGYPLVPGVLLFVLFHAKSNHYRLESKPVKCSTTQSTE